MGFDSELLLYCFVLILLLFLFQLWYENQLTNPPLIVYQIYFFTSYVGSLIFTVHGEEFFIHLSYLFLTLAVLYAGIITGIALLLVNLIIIGLSSGYTIIFWILFVFQYAIVILTDLFHPYFFNWNTKKKIIVVLSMVITQSGIFIFSQIFLLQNHSLQLWLGFLIGIITAAMLTYIFQSLKKHTMMKNLLVDAEKIKVAGYLSTSISHEVRNPLCVIRGFLQLLKDPVISHGKKQEFVDISINELDRTEIIISKYLDFSKPNQTLQEKINTFDVLKSIVIVATPLANMNSVKIIENIQQEIYITGNKNKLFQALLNIVKNGIEAMPDGGELLITSRMENGEIIIQIIDSGSGMTEEQITKLGEPYYSTKRNSGTGLGMMVTNLIIKDYQGKIKVNSKVGKGTTFTIVFQETYL